MIKHTGYIEFAKKANTPKPSHEKSRQYANLPNSFAPAFCSWKCKLHKTEMYRWGMPFQLSGVVVCERRDIFFFVWFYPEIQYQLKKKTSLSTLSIIYCVFIVMFLPSCYCLNGNASFWRHEYADIWNDGYQNNCYRIIRKHIYILKVGSQPKQRINFLK